MLKKMYWFGNNPKPSYLNGGDSNLILTLMCFATKRCIAFMVFIDLFINYCFLF